MMDEPTLEELAELEEDFDLDLDLDLEDEEEDTLLLEDPRYVSLDGMADEEYAADGSYYKSLGIAWDEVD